MNIRAWPAKRFHACYGIGWACLGLVIGLGCAKIVSIQSPPFAVIFILVALTGYLIWNGRLLALILVVVVSVVVGISRGEIVQSQLMTIESTVGSQIILQGKVFEDPQLSDRGDTKLVLKDIVIDNHSVRGQIWVTLRGPQEIGRGDSITVAGKATEGFGPYSVSLAYSSLLEIVPSRDGIRQLRDRFAESVRTYIVEPAASLGLGFVIGQRSALPSTLDDQLRIVGLTHIVVASGYNLTILVRFAKRLLEKKSKYATMLLSSVLILGFIAVSGASPSMIRAGLVTGLSIAAWYYGRRFHPILLIIYVMALTAMYDPMFLWADVGWWLSFLAFAGVLIVAPLSMRIVFKNSESKNSLVHIGFETMAAQIMTLPLILLLFGELPLLSLIANLLAAPFIPFAMALTFIAGVCGMTISAIAPIIALPAEIVLSYFVALVRFLATPEWAQQSIAFGVVDMVLSFGMIGIIVLIAWWKTGHNFRSQSIVD